MSRPLVASYCSVFLKIEMRHIYRQIIKLKQFQTIVITKRHKNTAEYPFQPLEVLSRPRKFFLQRLYLKYIKRCPPIVYRGEIDVLERALESPLIELMHVYFGHTGVHLLPFIKQWDRPVLVSFHGADVRKREDRSDYFDRLKELFEVVPLVLARSDSLKKRLIELGCPEKKIRLNRAGIPLDSYPFVKRTPPEDGAWRITQACRLIPKKGIFTALDAFAKFHKEYPKATFTIAGEGALQDSLHQKILSLNLERSVILSGFLSHRELKHLYDCSHIFLHPSQMTRDFDQEGVPNSMLEAMATGLPVVATFHGGIPEAVKDGESGFLLPERDSDGISDALKKMCSAPDQWAAMGQAASRAIYENFEQDAQIEKLEACYKELLTKNRRK